MAVLFNVEDTVIDTMTKVRHIQLDRFKKELYNNYRASNSKSYLEFLKHSKNEFDETKESIEQTRRNVITEVSGNDDEKLKELFNEEELFEIEMIDDEIYSDNFTVDNYDEKFIIYYEKYKNTVSHNHSELKKHTEIAISCNSCNMVYDDLEKNVNDVLNFIDVEIQREEIKGEKPKQLNSNRTDLSAPEKIAVLYEIGIQETLNKIPVQEDKYRFIHSLIGGSYDNVKKYMVNGLSKDNKLKAKDFINSKTI